MPPPSPPPPLSALATAESVCDFLSCKTSFGLLDIFFLSSNLCLQLRAVEHISLACNVTVALWRSVEWWCCVGKIAGGGCPTYPITTDVHHTSRSALSKRRVAVGSERGESTEGSERREDRCFGVNKAVGDWQQTGRCVRPSWRCMPTTSHCPWRNQSRSEHAVIKTSWTVNIWVMLSVLVPDQNPKLDVFFCSL